MELIERYIYAVTWRLPIKQREDIAKELRTLIEDMLDERVGKGQVTEKDIEEVLLELGNPKHLAEQYRGKKNYLIGPELFDSFWTVLKIGLITMASVMIMIFVMKLIFQPVIIIDAFVDLIVGFVMGVPIAIGWTVIGYGIIERFSGDSLKATDFNDGWHPKDLPALPDPKRQIKRCEPITGMVFIIIGLFFFLSHYFGIWVIEDGKLTTVIRFINEEQWGLYLVVVLLLFSLAIVKEVLKLTLGKWTLKLYRYTVFANLLSLIILAYLIIQPGIWNPFFMEQLVQTGWLTASSEAFHIVKIIWEKVTMLVLVFSGIGFIWDTIEGFIKIRNLKQLL